MSNEHEDSGEGQARERILGFLGIARIGNILEQGGEFAEEMAHSDEQGTYEVLVVSRLLIRNFLCSSDIWRINSRRRFPSSTHSLTSSLIRLGTDRVRVF